MMSSGMEMMAMNPSSFPLFRKGSASVFLKDSFAMGSVLSWLSGFSYVHPLVLSPDLPVSADKFAAGCVETPLRMTVCIQHLFFVVFGSLCLMWLVVDSLS